MSNLRLQDRYSQAPIAAVPLDERRLARRYFLKKMRWAREHGRRSIELSLRTCEALRPSIVTSLGGRVGGAPAMAPTAEAAELSTAEARESATPAAAETAA